MSQLCQCSSFTQSFLHAFSPNLQGSISIFYSPPFHLVLHSALLGVPRGSNEALTTATNHTKSTTTAAQPPSVCLNSHSRDHSSNGSSSPQLQPSTTLGGTQPVCSSTPLNSTRRTLVFCDSCKRRNMSKHCPDRAIWFRSLPGFEELGESIIHLNTSWHWKRSDFDLVSP